MSLFKKTIKNTQNNSQNLLLNFVEEYGFYIPHFSTIQAIQAKQPLSSKQVIDYINYIINNYYICHTNSLDFEIFIGEWTAHQYDPQLVNERMKQACIRLGKQLSNGESINIIEAMWLSYNIFVDDVPGLRRIITKKLIDNKWTLNVSTEKQSKEVVDKINNLNKRLIDLKNAKAVANTK